jgi:DNA-binding transcriptional LysR family regulator
MADDGARALLAGTNLNLLVVLDALLEERHVTRAGKRLGLTQSAVSNVLAQLRELFSDQLFLRTASGMVPTPRALELEPTLRRALALISASLGQPAFDPVRSTRTFTLATSDYGAFVVMPKLLSELSRQGAGLRVEVSPWAATRVPDTLERGTADLALGFYDEIPARHRGLWLFDETYACIARKGHPLFERSRRSASPKRLPRVSLEAWLAAEHVLVTQDPGARGNVDVQLAALGHTRRIGLRTSHFLMVPPLVASTDLVAAVNRRSLEAFKNALPLVEFQAPIPLPSGGCRLAWHERVEEDDAHRWLRDTLVRVVGAEARSAVTRLR